MRVTPDTPKLRTVILISYSFSTKSSFATTIVLLSLATHICLKMSMIQWLCNTLFTHKYAIHTKVVLLLVSVNCVFVMFTNNNTCTVVYSIIIIIIVLHVSNIHTHVVGKEKCKLQNQNIYLHSVSRYSNSWSHRSWKIFSYSSNV